MAQDTTTEREDHEDGADTHGPAACQLSALEGVVVVNITPVEAPRDK